MQTCTHNPTDLLYASIYVYHTYCIFSVKYLAFTLHLIKHVDTHFLIWWEYQSFDSNLWIFLVCRLCKPQWLKTTSHFFNKPMFFFYIKITFNPKRRNSYECGIQNISQVDKLICGEQWVVVQTCSPSPVLSVLKPVFSDQLHA